MTTNTNEELQRIEPGPRPAPIPPSDQEYVNLWFALSRRPWRSLILVPGHPGGSADKAARQLAEVGQKVSGLPVQAITMSSLDYGTALALADLQEQLRRLEDELVQSPQAIEVYPSEESHAHEGRGQDAQEHETQAREVSGPGDRQDGQAGEVIGEVHGDAPEGEPQAAAEAHAQPDWIPGDRTDTREREARRDWDRPAGHQDAGTSMLRPSMARFVISIPCLVSEPLGLSATQGADAVVFFVELGRTSTEDLKRMVDQVGRDRVAGCVMVK